MRRFACALLCALLCWPCLAMAEEKRIEVDSPDFVKAVLETAIAELGYIEGPNNLTKYGQWAGDPNAAWCAEFICWSVDQTDQRLGLQLLKSVYPKYSGQNTGRDWYIKRGRFVSRKGVVTDWGTQWLKGEHSQLQKNGYIPRPGDLVFFSYNGSEDTDHVALVEYCAYDEEGNVCIHVIEGNNPDRVQRAKYPLDNGQILGFGACEDVADTTIRYGNSGDKVLELQQRLNYLGYLQVQHLTGTFGSNTKRALMQFQETVAGQSTTGIADCRTQYAILDAVEKKQNQTPDTWLVAD